MLLTALTGIASDRPAAFALNRPPVLPERPQLDAIQRITTTNSPKHAASDTRTIVKLAREVFGESLRPCEPSVTVGIASIVEASHAILRRKELGRPIARLSPWLRSRTRLEFLFHPPRRVNGVRTSARGMCPQTLPGDRIAWSLRTLRRN